MKRYIWIILAVLVCLAVFTFKSKPPSAPELVATQPDSELRIFSLTTSWPLPYRVIPTGTPNRPEFPPAPPVPEILLKYWMKSPSLDGLAAQTLEARLSWVLNNHPERWLSEELLALDKNGQLRTGVQWIDTEGARFEATAGRRAHGVPTLLLMGGGLLKAKTEEDFLKIFISVRHEFVHYRRWLNSTEAEEAVHADKLGHLTDYCQFKWEDERDALFQTCPMTIEWGLTADTRAICLYSDDAEDFDHAYFMLILLQKQRVGQGAVPGGPLCLPFLAVMAGHPNPDEFKN